MCYFHFGEKKAFFFNLLNLVLKLHGVHCLQGTMCLTLFSQVHHAPEWDFVAAVLIQHILHVKYLKLG